MTNSRMKNKFCVYHRNRDLKVGNASVILFIDFLKPSSANGQIYVRRIMLLISVAPRGQMWRYSSIVLV